MPVRKPECYSGKSLTDEKLLKAYLKTNKPLYFNQLFGRYAERVHQQCMDYRKEPEESQDAMMSIFEKCYQKLVVLFQVTFNVPVFFPRPVSFLEAPTKI